MRRNQDHMLTDTNTEEQEKAFHKQTLGMEERWGQLNPTAPFETVWDRYLSAPRSEAQLKNRKRWKVAFSAFLILIAMGVTAVFTSPEVRAALAQFPFMKMLLKDGGFDDFGLSKIEKEHLGVQVDQSVTDKGIRFKMDEVFYDGVQIVLNYDVEYLDKKGKIDAKDASVYYNLDVIGASPNMMSTHKFTILKDHTFIGSTLIDAYQYLDGYQLHMKISQIGRITITPVTTQVVIKSEDKQDMSVSYGLQDNLQTWLQSGGSLGGGGEFIGNFSPPSAINPYPAYVELFARKQVKVTPQSTAKTANLKGHYPVELAGEGRGNINITKVEFNSGETIVYYEASDTDNQNPNLLLVNVKGEYPSIGQPERISKEKFLFRKKYPAMEADLPVQAKLYNLEYAPGTEPSEPVKILIHLDWSKP